MVELYLAGDSSGFPQATPQLLIQGFNVLLSYMHPSGKKGINRVGETKKIWNYI